MGSRHADLPRVIVEARFLDWDRDKPVLYSCARRSQLALPLRVVFELPVGLDPGTLTVIEMRLEGAGEGEGENPA